MSRRVSDAKMRDPRSEPESPAICIRKPTTCQQCDARAKAAQLAILTARQQRDPSRGSYFYRGSDERCITLMSRETGAMERVRWDATLFWSGKVR